MVKNFKIRVINPEVSALIQQLLFSVGGRWRHGGTKVQYTDRKYIFYDWNSITTCFSDADENWFTMNKNREITFEQLVEEIEEQQNKQYHE